MSAKRGSYQSGVRLAKRRHIRETCRKTELWPSVIADLIAEYAGFSLHERVNARLPGLVPCINSKDTDSYDNATVWMFIWGGAGTQIAYRRKLLSPTIYMTEWQFVQSIDTRIWQGWQGWADYPPLPMTGEDIAMLDRWLDGIDDT